MVRFRKLWIYRNEFKYWRVLRTFADSLGDLLEIEIPVIPKEKSRKGDQELRQWRMHVYEELGFDVL